jgi:hypothetical protein
VEAVREWVAQCHIVDTSLPAQLPYSAKDDRTGRVGGTAPRYDSQAVSEGQHGRDSPLTRCPRCARAFNALVRGVSAEATDPREPGARRSPARGGA